MIAFLAKELLLEAKEFVGESVLARMLSKIADTNSVDEVEGKLQLPGHIAEFIVILSRSNGFDSAEFQRRLGRRTIRSLARNFPDYFAKRACASELLEDVGAEVLNAMLDVFPDTPKAELCPRPLRGGGIEVIFRSTLPLHSYCQGLIEGCYEQFGESVTLFMHDLTPPTGSHAVYEIFPTR